MQHQPADNEPTESAAGHFKHPKSNSAPENNLALVHEDWVELSYADNSQTPLEGEIIMLRFSFRNVSFPYGPISHYAQPPPDSASNASRSRPNYHQALVTGVSSIHTGHIVFKIFPLVSYGSPPEGKTDLAWDPNRWMTEEATEIQRLHHLPVPALPDGGRDAITTLQEYHDFELPGLIFATPSVPTNTINSIIGETTLIPEYQNVWARILRDRTNVRPPSVCTHSTTESELERALRGDDVSFWENFPRGSSKCTGGQEEENLDKKISRWQNKCVTEWVEELHLGRGEEVKSEASLVEDLRGVDSVDVQDAPFGEEACDENDHQRDGAEILE